MGEVAANAVVVGLVVCGITLATNGTKVAALDLVAVLIDHQRVPVAILVRGLAQLAGERQLGLALLAEERAAIADLRKQLAIEPEQMNGVS